MSTVLTSISQKVTVLYDEVLSLNLDLPIESELVDAFDRTEEIAGRVIYRERTEQPVVQLPRSIFKDLHREHIVAHELMHIWRKRKLYPRVRSMPAVHPGDVGPQAGHDIENFIDHVFIFPELERRGFDSFTHINNDLTAHLGVTGDPEVPIAHIKRAFKIAEIAMVIGDRAPALDQLAVNLPYSTATAAKIMSVVSLEAVTTPDGSRRAIVKLIKLLDSLLSIETPLLKRLVVDLVLSRKQLSSPAINYMSVDAYPAGALATTVDVVQFVFRPDPSAEGVCSHAVGITGGVSPKTVDAARQNLRAGSLREYLAFYKIPYAERE